MKAFWLGLLGVIAACATASTQAPAGDDRAAIYVDNDLVDTATATLGVDGTPLATWTIPPKQSAGYILIRPGSRHILVGANSPCSGPFTAVDVLRDVGARDTIRFGVDYMGCTR